MKIKNLLFQPLALHLAGSGEGLHLSARECRQISKDQISEEIRLAARRGMVLLIDKTMTLDNGSSYKPESSGEATTIQAEQKRGRSR